MRRSSTRSKPKLRIMELPYGTHDDLAQILDPPGGMDWKNLVSLIPIYTAKAVQNMEIEGSKPGLSCTKLLLQDMDKREYDVDDLKHILKESGNKRAFGCLVAGLEEKGIKFKEPSVGHTQINGCKRQPLREPDVKLLRKPTLIEPMDDVQRLQERDERATEKDEANFAETRGTFIGDNQIQPRNGLTDLHNNKPGTRETFMTHSLSQERCGQQPGTKELVMKFIPMQETSEKEPGTREFIMKDIPMQVTSGQGPGTRETLISLSQETSDHPQGLNAGNRNRSLPVEHDENQYQAGTLWRNFPCLATALFVWMINCGNQ